MVGAHKFAAIAAAFLLLAAAAAKAGIIGACFEALKLIAFIYDGYKLNLAFLFHNRLANVLYILLIPGGGIKQYRPVLVFPARVRLLYG